ncbi:DUF3341 domain-containing protein [Roseomonas sp. M0104]|uniref:DUF3341 domain-containing protein n=1 Tax=Teichococcus coralli TaxID=2545983 RepID=A0A845B796_9PROT|nr:DUF3341 domain-containing protein [Pseudoroseomonas coralli]MXP62575.1 DUF3341 domain-containing protein [Pseudoroseomonas coralli]
MTALLLAEFRDPETLITAARRARDAGWKGLDAHTPFAVPELVEALGLPPARIRPIMLAAGAAAAVLTFAMCWYSAVIDYPLNLGGRPLNSWPTFMVLCFEAAVLAAALAGFIAFFALSGLPRLHHPLFAARDFERASQDAFFLAVQDPKVDAERLALLLDGLGPVAVREVAR